LLSPLNKDPSKKSIHGDTLTGDINPMPHRTPSLLFAAIFWGCYLLSAHAETSKYHIALIAPLSGQVAFLGEQVRKGVTLALEQLGTQGFNQIKLSIADDQFNPVQTVSAYNQINSKDQVDAVLVVGSPPANALAPIIEKNAQILIAVGASDPDIVKGRSKSFIHWVIPPVLGDALAAELQWRGFERWGVVSAEVSGALADSKALAESAHKLGIGNRVVYTESFAREETNYRTAISALKKSAVDVVVVVLFPGALSSFTKQAKQQGLRAEIVGMETFEDESEVRAANGSLDGAWYVTASNPESVFAEAYRTRWGETPGMVSGNAYDSLNLLFNAVSAGGRGSSNVATFLKTIKGFHGAVGTYDTSGDSRFNLPAAIKRITQHGFETIEHSGPKSD
jgi:branched-chain amino acid transport system substrate-binding protein